MTDTVDSLLGILVEFVPRLLGAVVVLLVALVVAYLLQRLMARFLEEIGLDDLFERTGAANPLSHLGYEGGPSRLLGIVLFWGLMLTGVAGSLSVLGLSSLENTMDQIVNLSGRALEALVILIAGVLSAGWLAELVGREAESAGLRGSNILRRVVFHHHSRRRRAPGRLTARPRDLHPRAHSRCRPRHDGPHRCPSSGPGARPPLRQHRRRPLRPGRHRGGGCDLR